MNFFDNVFTQVKRVPSGKVATYGQIAALSGNPRGARMVGWALSQMNAVKFRGVPWHRVINREGRISINNFEHPAQEQAALLKREGIVVKFKGGNYFVDLKKYLWRPPL